MTFFRRQLDTFTLRMDMGPLKGACSWKFHSAAMTTTTSWSERLSMYNSIENDDNSNFEFSSVLLGGKLYWRARVLHSGRWANMSHSSNGSMTAQMRNKTRKKYKRSWYAIAAKLRSDECRWYKQWNIWFMSVKLNVDFSLCISITICDIKMLIHLWCDAKMLCALLTSLLIRAVETKKNMLNEYLIFFSINALHTCVYSAGNNIVNSIWLLIGAARERSNGAYNL